MKKLILLPLLTILFSSLAIAGDVDIVGKKHIRLPTIVAMKHIASAAQQPMPGHDITLMEVRLSKAALNGIKNRVTTPIIKETVPAIETTPSLSRKQLGMAGVPVFDQGMHGSCVVFAVTAALDAALHRYDYISQLCLLQLGQQLQHVSYTPSGWDGSWGRAVYNQIETFGFVNKVQQLSKGCGGLKEYPTYEAQPEEGMSPAEYFTISEPLPPLVSYTSILELQHIIFDRLNMSDILDDVKASLRHGDRLTAAVFMVDPEKGVAGAQGHHRETYDTWILSPALLEALFSESTAGAHELIITGYDDDARAIDDEGKEHVGLLTLRSSWGKYAGDHGNFYMSYDYFKRLAFEIQRVRGPHILRFPDEGNKLL